MDTENPGVHQRCSGLARVAVTGAAGFLGGWIARQLRAQKIEVMALGADHLEMESQILAPLFENFAPTTIVHAAGPASVNFSMARPLIDFRRSVAAVYEVLEAARLGCPDALVLFLSSAAVYGNPETLPIAETAPARPVSPYGFHKLASELALREYREIYGLRSVSLRIFSAYGEGLRRQLLWDVCQKALRGNFVLQGDGSQTRDFIHACSVADAIAVLASQNGPLPEILNLASGEEVAVRSGGYMDSRGTRRARKAALRWQVACRQSPTVAGQCRTAEIIRLVAKDIRRSRNTRVCPLGGERSCW